MYFQVYSNSAYPQHSSERYWTNGSLVVICFQFLFFANGEGSNYQFTLFDHKNSHASIISIGISKAIVLPICKLTVVTLRHK